MQALSVSVKTVIWHQFNQMKKTSSLLTFSLGITISGSEGMIWWLRMNGPGLMDLLGTLQIGILHNLIMLEIMRTVLICLVLEGLGNGMTIHAQES